MINRGEISLIQTPRPLHSRGERREIAARHEGLAGKTVIFWLILTLTTLLLGAAVNAVSAAAAVGDAEAQGQCVQTSVQSVKRRLRIEWGVTDVEYRQQALALTPLGSSYDEVRGFILHEWNTEKLSLKPNPGFPPGMTLMGGSDIVLQPRLDGLGVSLFLRNEPPHIEIRDLKNPFGEQEGRRYIQPFFYYKPVWWKRSLYVTVLYVFDAHSRVIDLFAHGGIVMPSP